MKTLFASLFVLFSLLSTTAVRAQAPCATQKAQCESDCKSRARSCESAPPTGLVRDPGPEPAKTKEVYFSTVGAGVTTKNEFGWQPSQAGAQTLATDNARNMAASSCVSGGGRFHSTKMVVADPCQSKQEMGSTVWNCSVTLTGDCRREEANPAHVAWLQAKRERENDARQVSGRKSEFDQCHAQRNSQLSQCGSRCANICSDGSGGGGGAGTAGGASGSVGGNAATGNGANPYGDSGTNSNGSSGNSQPTVNLPPNAPRTAAEGIARADAYKANLDASFDQQMADMRAAMGRSGSLKGPAAAMAFAGVFAYPIAIAVNGVGFDAVVMNFLLPLLIGANMVTAGILGPWAYNKKRWDGEHTSNLPFFRQQVDAVCNSGSAEACAESRGALLRYLNGVHPSGNRQFLSFLLGPGRTLSPAFVTTSTIGFVTSTMSGDNGSIDQTGYFLRLAGRRGLARASIEMRPTWGDFNKDGESNAGTGYGMGIGVQLGTGFFSPYAEVRTHVQISHDYMVDSPGVDYGLLLGNTFNLHTLSAKAGSFTGAMAIDAGLLVPIGGPTESGFYLGLAYSWIKSARARHFDLAEFVEPRSQTAPEFLSARLTVGSVGLGAGVEVAHLRFDRPIINTLSVADVSLVPHGIGFSLVMPGQEIRKGKTRIFFGVTPLAGSWGENFVGYGKLRVGVGTDTSLARFDAGLEMPMYWSNDDGAYSSPDPLSVFFRVGY